jgi:hypothetical protein
MLIQVTISPDGNTEHVVLNAREDLRHDCEFFIMEAKKHAADGETQFLHQRFLRAALFLLFAYAESVVNGWLYRVLDSRGQASRFEGLEMRSLDQKIDILNKAISAVGRKPNLAQAKRIRNLWVHTKPDSEVKAYEHLTLTTVEQAASELETWMSAMGSSLSLERYPSSEKVANELADALGTITKSASSDPKRDR